MGQEAHEDAEPGPLVEGKLCFLEIHLLFSFLLAYKMLPDMLLCLLFGAWERSCSEGISLYDAAAVAFPVKMGRYAS